MNKTLMDKVRCLLIHSKLPQTLWAETLMTTCYLVNRSPSSALNFKTPVEMWLGRATNYTNLKLFGCPTYAHVKQGKLEPRALKCVFLGYPKGVKGYKLWCTEMRPLKCIVSRDVVFNESEMLMKKHQKDPGKPEGGLDSQGQHLMVELKGKSALDYHDEAKDMEREEAEDISETSGTHTNIQDYQLAKDRQMRIIKTPKRFAYADLIAYAPTAAHELDNDEPKTFREAISGKDADKWIRAMKDEIVITQE